MRLRRSHGARIAAAVLAVATLVLAAACGGGGSGSSSGKKTDLTVFFWVGGDDVAYWKHNVEQVNKDNSDLNLTLTNTSWTSYWQKLPQQASTNTLPCIAGLQFGYVGSVGNLFMPLNDLVKKNKTDLKKFEPTMLKELSSGGNLLALPYDFGPVVVVYNKKLFQDKGVPLPKPDWTWNDFVQDAQKLTGGGTYGWLPNVSLELGRNLTGKANTWVQNGKFNLTNPDFIASITPQVELATKYKVTPPFSTAPNWDPFGQGKVGMETNGPWSLLDYVGKNAVGFPVGWVPFPAGPNGSLTYNEGSGFGITKDCKNPDAAYKAIISLLNHDNETYLGQNGRAFPALLSATDSWKKLAGQEATDTMLTALKTAVPMEVTSNWTEFQNAISQFEPLLLNGQISPEKFAQDVQSKAGAGTGVDPGDISSLINGG